MILDSFKNILVVGIGLIGGSILKTLKKKKFKGCLYGIDLDESIIKKAYELDLINNKDNFLNNIEKDLLVVFSVPVLSIEQGLDLVNRSISLKHTVLTDTLSSKSKVIDFLQSNKEVKNRFVLSHPIAGSEKSGLDNSTNDLFERRLVIISPQDSNNLEDIEGVKNFWEFLGTKVAILDPKKHDEVFAKTSHLPHIIAYTLMDYLIQSLEGSAFHYSGGSLEDYTRISSSNPVMWKDIMISNKQELLTAIKGFQLRLEEVSKLIQKEDQESIKNFLESVKEKRDSLIDKGKG